MSVININKQSIFVGIGNEVWWKSEYNASFEKLSLSPNLKPDFTIKDIVSSTCGDYLGILTSNKCILIHKAPQFLQHNFIQLPRAGSKITFSNDTKFILAGDKTGDVFIFDLNKETSSEDNKIFGHLSLLTSILMTPDNKHIITSDRDEKIRVSNYPDTYNIQSFCLGHKEFITSIHLLPHNEKNLLSASGDGTVKIWDYLNGNEVYSLDINSYIENEDVLNSFQKSMSDEDIKVIALPINLFSCCKLTDSSSLLAVSMYTLNVVLVFKISTDKGFNSTLLDKVVSDQNITGISITPQALWVSSNGEIVKLEEWSQNEGKYSLKSTESFNAKSVNKEVMFQDDIRLLYKRKFDNLQEYQMKKKQRIETSK